MAAHSLRTSATRGRRCCGEEGEAAVWSLSLRRPGLSNEPQSVVNFSLAGAQMGRGKGKLVAVAMGTIAGAFLGNSIGDTLDRADQAYLSDAQSVAHTAPMGRAVEWTNPDSGHHGTVTPTRDGHDRITGDYCREYETTIFVDGREETGYGTACQKADGTWDIES